MVQVHARVSVPCERCAPVGETDTRTERDDTATPEQSSLLGQRYYYLDPGSRGVTR